MLPEPAGTQDYVPSQSSHLRIRLPVSMTSKGKKEIQLQSYSLTTVESRIEDLGAER